MTAPRICTVLMLALLLSACGSDAPAPSSDASPAPAAAASIEPVAIVPVEALPQGSLEAVALELGVTLDADGRVAQPVDRVRGTDTVHASLVTVGEAKAAMLRVRWRDAAGKELAADERAISTTGPAAHTFSQAPEGGWAPGRYELEVTMDGESAGVRAFEVR